jgi:O-antigen/teichoic acid export membrane protein
MRAIYLLLPLVRASTFTRNVLALMFGAAIGQVFTVIAAPVLTRLYNPEDLGIFALYSTVLFLSAPLVSARYELAIVPAKDRDEAFGLLLLSCLIAFVVGLLSLLVVPLARFAAVVGLKALVPYVWLLALSIVVSGIYQAFRQFSIREQQYRKISFSQLIQSGVSVSSQAAVGGLTRLGPWGLLLGQLTGIFASACGLGRGIGDTAIAWHNNHRGTVLRTLKEIAIRHRKHPYYLPWGGFVDALAQRLPVLVLSALYGSHFLGLYALADRLLRAPISLVGQASSQVLFQKMTEPRVTARMPQFLMKWSFGITLLFLVPFALLAAFSRPLFAFVLGQTWAPAGTLAATLIPIYWGAVVVSPISNLLIIANRQGTYTVVQSLFLVSGFASLCLGHHWFASGEATLLFYSFAQLFVYVIYLLVLFSAAKGQVEKLEAARPCAA